MSKETYNQLYEYVKRCVSREEVIHIVLAGMPGKCANREKVSYCLPDLGEFVTLVHLERINKLISYIYRPGIKFTFLSDYIGLKLTFFPSENEISYYVEMLREWINKFKYHIDIKPITDVSENINELENCYNDIILNCLKISQKNEKLNNQLTKSIYDNININSAYKYYKDKFNVTPDIDTVLYIAQKYYKDF